MTTKYAPVALFVFNRPELTAMTLDALSKNELAKETEFTIFCDGPRSDEDIDAVAAVRQVVREVNGFKRVTIVERPQNLGLAGSVIRGVTEMLNDNEAVIVLEDDLVTVPFFLPYMNEGLERYEADEKVISICAFTHPTKESLPEVFFLPGAHCWGWATWRRGWAMFEHDPYKCLSELERCDRLFEFDVNGAAPYSQFMQRAAAGEGESWALRWMASAILSDKLSLYPGRSLVQNIGFEGSGTNAGRNSSFETKPAESRPRIDIGDPMVDPAAFAEFRLFLLHAYWRSGLWNRLYYKLLKVLPFHIERWLYTKITVRMLRKSMRE